MLLVQRRVYLKHVFLTCQNDSLFSVLEYDAKFFPSGEKAQAVISALCA
jgi:hypothetical protein